VIPDSVGDWVRRRAVKSRGQAAIVFRDTRLSYDELADRIDVLAAALARRGVGVGDRVAYVGNNHPSFIETLFAVLRAGAIFVPLNTRLNARELEFQLADSGAAVLISAGPLEQLAAAATAALQLRRIVVDDPLTPASQPVPGAAEDYAALLAEDPLADYPPIGHDDPALIIYTSGTTGRPKGAVLSHGNLTWNSINAIVDYDVTAATRQLLISPLFHVAAFGMGALPTLLKGGTLLMQERFVPAEALAVIERLRATHISGVPTTYQMMMEDPAWATTDISSLLSMTCGGSAVPRRVIDAYAERGLAFSGGYGMTETSPGIVAMPPMHAADRAGASGLAHFFTRFRIRDLETGRLVGPGERGEIEAAGPNVMREYWGRPDASADAFTSDGWFKTGDIGVTDGDGFLTVVDRAKDMIISGGENIYSAEVELALAAIPGVTGAAVIGVPHDRWGEVPHAIVTLAPGAALTAPEMTAFLSTRLARYKVPKTLDVVDELPRTASGKVRKSELRARCVEASTR
jgi:fatty-acyl-CoA synthase